MSGTHGIPSGGGGCAAHRPPHRRRRKKIPSTRPSGYTAAFNAICDCKLRAHSKYRKIRPRTLKSSPRILPEASKIHPGALPRAKMRPGSARRRPRAPTRRPRSGQEAPKSAQETPKSAQDAPKIRPGPFPNLPKSNPGSIQTQRLHDLCRKFHLQSPRTHYW